MGDIIHICNAFATSYPLQSAEYIYSNAGMDLPFSDLSCACALTKAWENVSLPSCKLL